MRGISRAILRLLRIEPFTYRDTDEVVALCAAEGWPSWTPAKIAAAFTSPGVVALTARDESGLVGVAELLTDGEVIAYLGLLVVARQARRMGVGRGLVDELFARSGLSRIDLLAETDSTEFYQSFPHKVKAGYRLYPRG